MSKPEFHNTSFQNKNCDYCHVKLTISQSIAGNVCNNIQCRIAWQDDIYKQEQLRKQEKLEMEKALTAKAHIYRDQLLTDTGDKSLTSVPVAIVPANEKNITDLPQQRINAFLDHILRCINEAKALQNSKDHTTKITPAKTDSLVNAETLFERKALIQACSTCKGLCCLKGGVSHAYQDAVNMFHYMKNNEGKDSDGIIAEYLNYIPPRSYEDSCVYHTDSGCTLPRNMRAEICNKHLCQGLRAIKREFSEPGPETLFIVAENNYHIVRSTLVGQHISTKHFPKV